MPVLVEAVHLFGRVDDLATTGATGVHGGQSEETRGIRAGSEKKSKGGETIPEREGGGGGEKYEELGSLAA